MKVLLLLLPLLAIAAQIHPSRTEEYYDTVGHDTAGHETAVYNTASHDTTNHDTHEHDVDSHDAAEHDMAEHGHKAAQPRRGGKGPVKAQKIGNTLTCFCQVLHGPMLECAYSQDDRDLWSCYKILHEEGLNFTVKRGYLRRENCDDDDWLDQQLASLHVHSAEYQPRVYCCHDKDFCNGGMTAAVPWLLMPLVGVLLLTAY